MMHKNFMHRHLCVFVVQQSCMKFYSKREVKHMLKKLPGRRW